MHEEQDVPGEESLWRRVSVTNPHMMRRDTVTEEERPTSAAFKPKPHEDGTSVYVRGLLHEMDLDAAAVIVKSDDSVWEVTVKDIQDVNLDVRLDLWPQDIENAEHLRNGAHALIVGWDGWTKGQISSAARALAKVAVCVYRPDGA
ncbi:hypothetical protein OG866_12215 [Streptomyces sp. NBC_00663]|uniref:hypothetical protein n=1 Tax=Streptomyces sp. NBC_00663 TaxID=2975801 RepID=UPI002E311A6C|nr:hypothetical protein [Streptomyces sp. NBC_00663]